jgi:mono/diheme cytochrome c family protein
MKRLGFCAALLFVLASFLSAQSPVRRSATGPAAGTAAPPAPLRPVPTASQLFQEYCFECHGTKDPAADLSIERLIGQSATTSVGARWQDWERVVEMLESGKMPPPDDATVFPSDEERAAAAAWVRSSLKAYEDKHAGDPGRVTVRRLTSAEYAYAVRDLTGIDIKVGIDASSDSVGGEGFANFGDVQFVQDASVERYLEAAKQVADHAVIGAGPLEFYADAGKTGLELSALNRINELYATRGFRVVSGEGGRPFGLERYGKAFFVAWYYKHRVALGDPAATVRGLAAKEGITGRFADHIWAVVNKPNSGYPARVTVDGWTKLPAPTPDVQASIAKARAGCDELYKTLTTWPSWFFARGDLAAGGAGDESPLVFDDSTLQAEATHHYAYVVGPRAGRGRGAPAPAPGPWKVYLTFSNVNPAPGVAPVVIWRNPRVLIRAAAAPAEGAPAAATAGRGRGAAGPVLATHSLRSVLPADAAATLKFGTSPDGTAIGPDDFATTGTAAFSIDAPAGGAVAEFQVDAELGKDRNAVVRVMISDRPEGSARDAITRVLIGDPRSAGYETFRTGIAEYVSLLPPNSHGEANPADKDPVPAPFDNTYNSPEHDAFVLKVKYQRSDGFFTRNLVDGADRARLNHAWNDLFGSWPYHDAYLEMLADHFGLKLKSRQIKDLTPAEIAALPAAARPHVTALRAHFDEVVKAQTLAQPGHVTDALAFASRAWRRPLTPAEKTSLRAFYEKSRTLNKLDHDAAIRALVARVLVSPAFLYRVETVAHGPEKPLSGWEMASRMSFFLWSSIPDDELRRAAAAGELSDPAKVARQVKRMTADPKARRLATEFFGQWLGFYQFDEYRGIDTGRFPEFTDEVKSAMYDESISTFEYIVRQDRPVKEILSADYTFLNKPLAKFYGISRDVKSTGPVEKVDGAHAFDRGGAFRLGSVLTTTSAPLRTSPVKRGNWVLRRILGTPTPPPPANAGTIPADDKTFNGLTLRERLAQHKRSATCAACHLRIDPLGFPLEGFDAVGRVRDKYADGKAVDVTGELADKSTIVGANGLLDYLQGRDTQVMTTLSKKMIGYALGRTVMASDRPLIREMISAGGNAAFSDLAVKIVTSRQFRNRSGDEGAPAARAEVPSRPAAANKANDQRP